SLIVSVGAAYTGLERWVLAADVRYIDYENTRGVGDSGFTADGAVRGPGWRSVVAVALGAQYRLTDTVAVRAGYSFNENPVPDSQSFINTVAPVVVEHLVSLGASWQVTPDFALSLAYVHAFENSVEGPLLTPAGPVAGTAVRNTASGDLVVLGATVRFGKPPACEAAER